MYVAVLAVLDGRDQRAGDAARCWVGLTPPGGAERLLAARADAGGPDLPPGYRDNPAAMLAARALARGLRVSRGVVLGRAQRSAELGRLRAGAVGVGCGCGVGVW